MTDSRSAALLADGYERWLSPARAAVHAEVALEYAERLRQAGLWRRWRLRIEMKREIVRRLQSRSPSPESLY